MRRELGGRNWAAHRVTGKLKGKESRIPVVRCDAHKWQIVGEASLRNCIDWRGRLTGLVTKLPLVGYVHFLLTKCRQIAPSCSCHFLPQIIPICPTIKGSFIALGMNICWLVSTNSTSRTPQPLIVVSKSCGSP